MKTTHIFEEGYYLISNKSVAQSFMFADESDSLKFRDKIQHHLSPICDILSYGFQKEEYQIVLRMKSRVEIESYFIDRYSRYYKKHGLVPETTYIIAQAMANMQSGYVKWFNFKYDRDGGLMAGRYSRQLIESEGELDRIIESVNSLVPLNMRSARWIYRSVEIGNVGDKLRSEWSSYSFYNGGDRSENGDCSWVKLKNEIYVRGHFENLPPKELDLQDLTGKLENFIKFIFLRQK